LRDRAGFSPAVGSKAPAASIPCIVRSTAPLATGPARFGATAENAEAPEATSDKRNTAKVVVLVYMVGINGLRSHNLKATHHNFKFRVRQILFTITTRLRNLS
jgi:hypothetical protein